MVGFSNTRSCLVYVICFNVCSFDWTSSSRFSSLPLPSFRPSPFQVLDYEQCFILFEIGYSLPCAYICSCHPFNVFVSPAFIFNALFLSVFFSLHLSSPRWSTVKSRRGKWEIKLGRAEMVLRENKVLLVISTVGYFFGFIFI